MSLSSQRLSHILLAKVTIISDIWLHHPFHHEYCDKIFIYIVANTIIVRNLIGILSLIIKQHNRVIVLLLHIIRENVPRRRT